MPVKKWHSPNFVLSLPASAIFAALRRVIRYGSELLFPEVCVFCGREIGRTPFEWICRSCASQIPFRSSASACVKCLQNRPDESFGRAGERNIDVLIVCRYEKMIREALIQMKFADGAYMKHALGSIAAYFLLSRTETFDAIVPIPLHRRRLLERGYNQSELLARKIASLTNIPVWNDCLYRSRHTKRQSDIDRQTDRLENVTGAFSCRSPERFVGKRILLLDDILTSGETMMSAATAIKEAVEACRYTDENAGRCECRITGFVLASGRK